MATHIPQLFVLICRWYYIILAHNQGEFLVRLISCLQSSLHSCNHAWSTQLTPISKHNEINMIHACSMVRSFSSIKDTLCPPRNPYHNRQLCYLMQYTRAHKMGVPCLRPMILEEQHPRIWFTTLSNLQHTVLDVPILEDRFTKDNLWVF